jgi:hypothetical protein
MRCWNDRTIRSVLVAALTGLALAPPRAAHAHDIPSEVLLRVFAKPEGTRLRLLVRAPLAAMRDFEFPVRGAGGYLDIARVQPMLRDAARLWIANYVQLYEGDSLLPDPTVVATRVSLPSDRSFGSYEAALAHLSGPALAEDTELPWQQALMDVELDYVIRADSSRFSIHPTLAHLGVRTTTVLRFLPPHGAERAFEYLGDPGLVRLDPRWYQAALRFVELGVGHILSGIDHLLFIFCLVIPFRRIRPLLTIVTAFTAAHSITLFASALGYAPDALWFPPLIEVLIALSIVYMAFENIVGAKLERRWMIAFGFGLVHGFGFSFALRESLQFAGGHLLTSLFAFNAGVEVGQVFVLALAIPLLNLLFRYVVAERMGTILLSALVAHTAWHWMLDRGAVLRQYQFTWPAFDMALVASLMRGLMLVLALVAVLWGLSAVYERLLGGEGRGRKGVPPVGSREPAVGAPQGMSDFR